MLASSSTLLTMSMSPKRTSVSMPPGQIDPKATCPACSLDLSHQVSTLVQRYEQLQHMVTSLAASRPSKKAKLQRQVTVPLGSRRGGGSTHGVPLLSLPGGSPQRPLCLPQKCRGEGRGLGRLSWLWVEQGPPRAVGSRAQLQEVPTLPPRPLPLPSRGQACWWAGIAVRPCILPLGSWASETL